MKWVTVFIIPNFSFRLLVSWTPAELHSTGSDLLLRSVSFCSTIVEFASLVSIKFSCSDLTSISTVIWPTLLCSPACSTRSAICSPEWLVSVERNWSIFWSEFFSSVVDFLPYDSGLFPSSVVWTISFVLICVERNWSILWTVSLSVELFLHFLELI